VSEPILGLTSDALVEATARRFPGHGAARAIYRLAHLEGRFEPEALGLSRAACQAWRAHFRWTELDVRRVVREPAPDGRTTEKAVLATADGLEVECVRIPMGLDRSTLCISSQVGCRMACAFCETAKMGLVRNLSADEIVGQVVMARSRLGWQVDKIVFMGMGEPLDNPHAVVQALRVLHDRRGLGFGQPNLTICTAGRVEGLAALSSLGWSRLNLSVSLNAADDRTRSKIMPVNRSADLKALQAALIAYRPRPRFIFAVNYCLLPGINDERDDARAVAEFCRPLGRVLVNVIPYNPGSKPLTRAPKEEETDTFIGWLKDEGLAVQRRRTKGRSVMAACGQLGNRKLRRRLAVVDGR
jgi:23S rRNA (adenine2503-C2)-methyltransferase